MTDADLGLADGQILPFLYVRDWAAAQHFYADVLCLGWTPVTKGWVNVRTSGGTLCALIDETTRFETTPPHRAGVFLMVPDRIEARVAACEARGAAIVRGVRRFSHGAEAAIADPDGNVIVLYETTIKPQA
jgi:predicted enzyme related to lactoylglutathione lyase